MLDPRNMPLLEYLDIRVSNMGEGKHGIRNIPEEIQLRFDVNYCHRVAAVELQLTELDHRRSFTDEMDDGNTSQDTVFEDVRKYTLHQWQERVFHNRDGPWKDPQTKFVRPQVISGWSGDDWRLAEPYEFAPDAKFSINKPDGQDLLRKHEYRMLRQGKAFDPQVREALAQRLREQYAGEP